MSAAGEISAQIWGDLKCRTALCGAGVCRRDMGAPAGSVRRFALDQEHYHWARSVRSAERVPISIRRCDHSVGASVDAGSSSRDVISERSGRRQVIPFRVVSALNVCRLRRPLEILDQPRAVVADMECTADETLVIGEPLQTGSGVRNEIIEDLCCGVDGQDDRTDRQTSRYRRLRQPSLRPGWVPPVDTSATPRTGERVSESEQRPERRSRPLIAPEEGSQLSLCSVQ